MAVKICECIKSFGLFRFQMIMNAFQIRVKTTVAAMIGFIDTYVFAREDLTDLTAKMVSTTILES